MQNYCSPNCNTYRFYLIIIFTKTQRLAELDRRWSRDGNFWPTNPTKIWDIFANLIKEGEKFDSYRRSPKLKTDCKRNTVHDYESFYVSVSSSYLMPWDFSSDDRWQNVLNLARFESQYKIAHKFTAHCCFTLTVGRRHVSLYQLHQAARNLRYDD